MSFINFFNKLLHCITEWFSKRKKIYYSDNLFTHHFYEKFLIKKTNKKQQFNSEIKVITMHTHKQNL